MHKQLPLRLYQARTAPTYKYKCATTPTTHTALHHTLYIPTTTQKYIKQTCSNASYAAFHTHTLLHRCATHKLYSIRYHHNKHTSCQFNILHITQYVNIRYFSKVAHTKSNTATNSPNTAQVHTVINTSHTENTNTHNTTERNWYTVIRRFVVIPLCLWFTFTFIGGISYGSGWSMYPTMNPAGIYFLYERITPVYLHQLQRGDIVMCNVGTNERGVVKRIIGLPGDTIRRNTEDPTSLYTLCTNECWLQGDLLGGSNDSRMYGPVPVNSIHGRVVAVLYPFNEAKWLDRTLQYRGY